MRTLVTWRQIRSWLGHGALTFGAGLLLGFAGATAVAGFYTGREATQHRFERTLGVWAWMDRIADALVPWLVVWWLL